jgi:CRISPR/Cas system-associated endoribonuclease Cas2
MVKYVLLYDIPREEKVLQVKVNRKLHSIDAEKVQHSVWESKKLEELKDIAKLIKQKGGEAIILEEKIIY